MQQQQPGSWQAAGPSLQATPFELSPQQNVVVRKLASAARLWGIVSVAAGAVLLMVAGGAIFLVTTMSGSGLASAKALAIGVASLAPGSLSMLICGWFYVTSAKSLVDVVETQGNDVPLLMNAMVNLKKAFMIEGICIFVSIIIAFMMGMFWRST